MFKSNFNPLKALDYVQVISAALGAALSKTISFRVGNYQATISESSGAPVHFSFGQAIVAAEMAVAGQTAQVQLGSIVLSVGPYITPTATGQVVTPPATMFVGH